MTAGLKIVNDAGTVLIDDSYPVLTLRGSGSVTIPAEGYTSLGELSGTVALSSTTAVSACAFPANDPLPAGMYVFGVPGTSARWYSFDTIAEPASTFGLVVRNAQGLLMYDAAARPARVAGLRSGSSRSVWPGTVTMPAGRTYAVVNLQAAFDSNNTFTRVGAGSPDQYFQRETISLSGAAVSGNSVIFSMVSSATRVYGPYTGAALPTNYSMYSDNAAFAILDVTNY